MSYKVIVKLLLPKFLYRSVLTPIYQEFNETTDERLSIVKTDNCRSKVLTIRVAGSVEGRMNVKGRATKNRPMSFRTSYQLGGPLLRGAGSSYWSQHVIYIARYITALVLGPMCTRARHVSCESSHGF